MPAYVQVVVGCQPFARGAKRDAYMVWEVDRNGSVGDRVLVGKFPRVMSPLGTPTGLAGFAGSSVAVGSGGATPSRRSSMSQCVMQSLCDARAHLSARTSHTHTCAHIHIRIHIQISGHPHACNTHICARTFLLELDGCGGGDKESRRGGSCSSGSGLGFFFSCDFFELLTNASNSQSVALSRLLISISISPSPSPNDGSRFRSMVTTFCNFVDDNRFIAADN